ncbi:protein charybde-like [Coccinella septempunctata]|uniref:protein charybde-like n=1 Tax=Coccinella septempunctata TaxID=41139 RepID=UPI001D06A3E4|nr:protein charybde-like [Coccinella septempunctata]
MFRSNFQEENAQKDSKLQAVFSKLSGVFPRAEDFGNSNKTMSSEIIESVLVDSPIPLSTNWNYEAYTISEEGEYPVIASITQRLESELRRAKSTHLFCGEVLLPCGLLQRIAADIVSMAENEPCGLRGCGLHLFFERVDECMSLGMLRCDPSTACTFELHLTLKQNNTRWTFLPQFLRNLTRGGTIVVSPAYTISKKKLYRTQSTD